MNPRRRFLTFLAVALLVLAGARILGAQETLDLGQALRWRSIGPDRGGRVTAVAGLVNDRFTYYMGATGGGVWKTVNAGITWSPISDRFFKTGSVGSIAVSESNPNIIYVGMGEACLRSNISHGDGVYKSTDGGKTWRNIGLRDTSQIGKVLIDPRNPDLVYVAAIGHPYGPNEERGVFRSEDGGQTWKKILFVNDKTGAADLVADPRDPRIMYASTWQVLRMPWDIDEVGPGSGIYKTTDGGDTWTRLVDGLPKTDMGKIGLTASPMDSRRVWATIGGDDGGIYRSDDAGKTWQLLNGSFEMHSRQYYYGHIFADPQQLDTVYTFSSKDFYKSTDGGKTWGRIQTPHGDYHDLWIDPHDDQRMVNGNDGGATVTFDGGKSWSSENNQPTAQFYTVRTDNSFPYRIYGAQQDNTTVSISSDASAGGRGAGPGAASGPAFEQVGGGESGYVVPDLQDSNIIYAGAYWGLLTRFDRRTGIARNITVWPDYPGGRTGSQQKYRFQWTFPIAETPVDPGVIYAGGNVVFKSTDQGASWQPISTDLTRNDKIRENGGRLEDVYCTVFTIAASPVDKNTIWAGSDDGLIHVTRNGGKTWSNVTPEGIQPWTRINIIEASSHDPSTAYAAVNRYQMDDFRPYIYRTHDYGKTWKLIVNGIPSGTFVRTVRQDPARPELLFAGTETGVYVSFDEGGQWRSLQLNLPVVPVTDLTVKNSDLIASTQGRAFWILDNISPLEETTSDEMSSKMRLFKPRAAYRTGRGGRFGGGGVGLYSGSVIVDYDLPQASEQPVTLEFQDVDGKTIRKFTSGGQRRGRGQAVLTNEQGLNRFAWDMRYPDARGVEGRTFLLGGSLRGPQAAPGEYKVKLTVGDQSTTQAFEIKKDPRVATTTEQYKEQLTLTLEARDKLSAADDAINQISEIQGQVNAASQKAGSNAAITGAARTLDERLDAVLHRLYEPRFTGFDDQTLIYPLQLNNRLAAMQNYLGGDYGPTTQDIAVLNELSGELSEQLADLTRVLNTDLPAFNAKLKAAGIAPVNVSQATSRTAGAAAADSN
ncbi:MAG: VPS10 domain-containing protein [Candidatus Acidiferrales bacterium]